MIDSDMGGVAVSTRQVTAADRCAIDGLQERVFGPGRFARTAYRVREGTPYASRFCRLAEIDKRVIASLRMTPVSVGGRGGALLLGPLAVDSSFANLGHGRRLIAESLAAAKACGIGLILLVGDMSYYGRLGFSPVLPAGRITFPGPVDPARILALELRAGALADSQGMVAADKTAPDWL
jgi:predicted N-acetyltransferase YhbS